MENEKIFKDYMTALGEIHDKEITHVLKNIYWLALEPFTDEQCKKAFDYIIARSKWFPKPADLIEAIEGGNPQIEDVALVEANKIIQHLNSKGSYEWPIMPDPITAHLMAKRWPYKSWASQVLESELKWWVKEFCEAYRAYSAVDVPLQIEAPEEMKPILGMIGQSIAGA